jgi:hypothetical protein
MLGAILIMVLCFTAAVLVRCFEVWKWGPASEDREIEKMFEDKVHEIQVSHYIHDMIKNAQELKDTVVPHATKKCHNETKAIERLSSEECTAPKMKDATITSMSCI